MFSNGNILICYFYSVKNENSMKLIKKKIIDFLFENFHDNIEFDKLFVFWESFDKFFIF